jgi:hypothetical protein
MSVSTPSQSPFNVEYTDDMEAGVNSRAGTGTWNQIRVGLHSPTTCRHDSPAGNYADNADMSITGPVINLSGDSLIFLRFILRGLSILNNQGENYNQRSPVKSGLLFLPKQVVIRLLSHAGIRRGVFTV